MGGGVLVSAYYSRCLLKSLIRSESSVNK